MKNLKQFMMMELQSSGCLCIQSIILEYLLQWIDDVKILDFWTQQLMEEHMRLNDIQHKICVNK